jgi:hypothetical protein
MTIALASERRLLAQDEFEPIVKSHYPVIETLSREELVALGRWLRERRARARGIIHDRRRVVRGKGAARGTATETASERGLAAKKQVFSNALKRVNGRLAKMEDARRRALLRERLQAALGRKQAARPSHPPSGPAANRGMRVKQTAKHRRVLQEARIGRVSQSVRDAQAVRDAREAG